MISRWRLRRGAIAPESESPVRVVDGNVVELVGRAYRRFVRELLDIGRLSVVGGKGSDSGRHEREAAEGIGARRDEAVAKEVEAGVMLAECGGG